MSDNNMASFDRDEQYDEPTLIPHFTKEEIREKLEIWFKYRDDKDHDFRLKTSIDSFNVGSERVTKFPRMED